MAQQVLKRRARGSPGQLGADGHGPAAEAAREAAGETCRAAPTWRRAVLAVGGKTHHTPAAHQARTHPTRPDHRQGARDSPLTPQVMYVGGRE